MNFVSNVLRGVGILCCYAMDALIIQGFLDDMVLCYIVGGGSYSLSSFKGRNEWTSIRCILQVVC